VSNTSSAQARAAPPVTVLAVDDQPVFLRAAHALIAATPGFQQVGEATSGREALEKAAALRPDLVLLDVRMPEMDGIALLEVLRSYLRWTKLPVILLTAHANKQQVERARELGVTHVFHKANFKLADLHTALQEILPRQTQSHA